MNIIISGHKIEVTEALKSIVAKKLGKLDKFFPNETDAKVTLSVQNKGQQIVELTIFSSGMIYRAEEGSSDMYASIDKVVAAIDRQIRKNKTKLEKRLRTALFEPSFASPDAEVTEEAVFKIVKNKRYNIKPMSPEEAILQMNLIGHTFFIFENADSNETNLVYKRKDGDYGLIEIG